MTSNFITVGNERQYQIEVLNRNRLNSMIQLNMNLHAFVDFQPSSSDVAQLWVIELHYLAFQR